MERRETPEHRLTVEKVALGRKRRLCGFQADHPLGYLRDVRAVFGISCVASHGLRLRSQGVLSDALASRHDRGAQRVADRHRCNYVRQDRGQIRLQIDPPVNREVSPFPSCRSPGLEHSS